MKLIKKIALASLVVASSSSYAISLIGPSVDYNGHSYTLISSDNWTNSEAFAVSQGGHLVAVNDDAENTFLTTTFGFNKPLWIGLVRAAPHSPTFVWSNGDAVTYTNWAGGEPNDAGWGEQYTHTYTSGQWNDLVDNSGYAGPKFGVLEVASVSEPSLLMLALSGLGFLGLARRRAK